MREASIRVRAGKHRSKLAALLLAWCIPAWADTDYFESFLYDQGYLKGDENPKCPLLTAMSAKVEIAWREEAGQLSIQSIPNRKGGAIVAWSEGGSRIYLQSIDAQGKRQWGPIPVSKAITRQGDYHLVPDGFGGVLLAWLETRYGCAYGIGANYFVLAQRFDNRGNEQWGRNGMLIASGDTNRTPPIIAADGKGGAIVAWTQTEGFNQFTTLFQRIDRSGKKLWSADGISIHNSPQREDGWLWPMVSDALGGVLVAVSGRSQYVRRITEEGNELWSEPGLVLESSTNSPDPQLIPDGSGGAIVSMTTDYGNSETIVTRLGSNGEILWRTVLAQGYIQQFSRILSDGHGGAFVVWRTGESDDYFAQRVNAQGEIQWKQNLLLGHTALNEAPAQVIADDNGGIIAAWISLHPVSGMNWPEGKKLALRDVYAQAVSAKGKARWEAPRVVAANIGKKNWQHLSLVSDGKSGAIIIWADGRRGFDIAPLQPEDEGPETTDPQITADLYAQYLLASGELAWQEDGVDISARPDKQEGCLERTSPNGVVAGLAVNLRIAPDASSEVVLKLTRGTAVTALESVPSCETIAGRKGRWTRVRVPSAAGQEGWVFGGNIVYPQHADDYEVSALNPAQARHANNTNSSTVKLFQYALR